jgi:hypothetical protein
MRSVRSGLKRNGHRSGSSGLERGGGGGGSSMLVVDGVGHPPIASSARLSGGIQLSQLPDPRNVREALAAHDTEGWREAMNREIENLRSHDVYELVPTLRLAWVLHRKFKNGVFYKNKALVADSGNYQRPGIDYNESFSLVMRLESLHFLLALAAIRDLDIVQFDITSAYSRRRSIWSRRNTRKGGLGVEAQEGSLRVSTGWENMERRAECSHGECGIRCDAKRPRRLPQGHMEPGGFRRRTILGGRFHRDRIREGAGRTSKGY